MRARVLNHDNISDEFPYEEVEKHEGVYVVEGFEPPVFLITVEPGLILVLENGTLRSPRKREWTDCTFLMLQQPLTLKLEPPE